MIFNDFLLQHGNKIIKRRWDNRFELALFNGMVEKTLSFAYELFIDNDSIMIFFWKL